MGKIQLSADEKLLLSLDKIAKDCKESADRREVASSLCKHFLRVHAFTSNQRIMAANMVSAAGALKRLAGHKMLKGKDVGKSLKYHLYAVNDGVNFKVGVTTNIEKRIVNLQTGSATKLSLAWKFYVGSHKGRAYALEKKLHRRLKAHKLEGEWFSSDCLPMIEAFKPKLRDADT